MNPVLQDHMLSPAGSDFEAGSIDFCDLFKIEDIQTLQDRFSRAMGVASVITGLDGTPITQLSGFTQLCAGIIRQTDQGRCNCSQLHVLLGSTNPDGPTVCPCLRGGLWEAGVSIVVGGRHIANWLVGQVRNEAQDDTPMRAHAREMGADEDVFMQAFHELPCMSRERFDAVAQMLFTVARQLSSTAYQNVQQARFIAQRDWAERALRASEEQFRNTIERSGAGYFRIDRQGYFEAANRALLGMHGFTSAAQILGEHFSTTPMGQDYAASGVVIEAGLAGHDFPSGEFVRRRVDGSVGFYTFSLHPVRRAEVVVAVEGFVIDTTSLHRAVADYKMLFDTMLDGFALHDVISDSSGQPVDCRYVAVNPAFERQTGLKAADLIGRTVTQVLPTIDQAWSDAFRQVASTGEAVVFESHNKRLNRYFTISAFRPSPGRFACVMVDNTARKLAEIELRKLLRAVQQSPSMLLITSAKGVIEYVNPCFTATTGYNLDDVRGENAAYTEIGRNTHG